MQIYRVRLAPLASDAQTKGRTAMTTVAEQAEIVKALKASGKGNKDPVVIAAVAVLKELKAGGGAKPAGKKPEAKAKPAAKKASGPVRTGEPDWRKALPAAKGVPRMQLLRRAGGSTADSGPGTPKKATKSEKVKNLAAPHMDSPGTAAKREEIMAKLAAAQGTPAPAPAPAAGGAAEPIPGPEADAVKAVGEKIRDLKKAKAEKDLVMAEVANLQAAKAAYEAKHGQAYPAPPPQQSPKKSKKKKKK